MTNVQITAALKDALEYLQSINHRGDIQEQLADALALANVPDGYIVTAMSGEYHLSDEDADSVKAFENNSNYLIRPYFN